MIKEDIGSQTTTSKVTSAYHGPVYVQRCK